MSWVGVRSYIGKLLLFGARELEQELDYYLLVLGMVTANATACAHVAPTPRNQGIRINLLIIVIK